MAAPSSFCNEANSKWVGVKVTCYVRLFDGKRHGPFEGVVRGVSTNQAVVEIEGGNFYDATGLLVEIWELGRNRTFGEWPVSFDDVELK